jgi:hypothetical protein
MKHNKINVLKKDEMYKELRYILKYMLGKPTRIYTINTPYN